MNQKKNNYFPYGKTWHNKTSNVPSMCTKICRRIRKYHRHEYMNYALFVEQYRCWIHIILSYFFLFFIFLFYFNLFIHSFVTDNFISHGNFTLTICPSDDSHDSLSLDINFTSSLNRITTWQCFLVDEGFEKFLKIDPSNKHSVYTESAFPNVLTQVYFDKQGIWSIE